MFSEVLADIWVRVNPTNENKLKEFDPYLLKLVAASKFFICSYFFVNQAVVLVYPQKTSSYYHRACFYDLAISIVIKNLNLPINNSAFIQSKNFIRCPYS
jgi:hypothetical protein